MEATREKQEVAQAQLEETKAEYEKTKTEYETLAQEIEALAGQLQEEEGWYHANQLKKQQMESQIELLKEQINTAHASDAHLKSRITLIDKEQRKDRAAGRGGAAVIGTAETGRRGCRRRKAGGGSGAAAAEDDHFAGAGGGRRKKQDH